MIEVRTIAPGKKIAEAGVYDLPMEDYHAQPCDGPSVSSSGLRTVFSVSPAHFWAESSLNPNRDEQKDKGHFALGRAAHHLILGEADFRRIFSVRPSEFPDWRTKASQEWKAKQALERKTVLVPADLDLISGMAGSLATHPLVQHGILNGEIERSLLWRDPETGIWLKSRPDAIPTDSGDFSDLKTTTSVAPDDIQRTIGDYRYDMQAAVVRRAAREVLGVEMVSFNLVFVEKTAPFCVSVVEIPPADIDMADIDLQVALRTIAHCLETGKWPGPGGTQSDARSIYISDWMRKRNEARRAFLEQELAS
ncbi:PD-(D/E)XK nuclease-like domain-containing protein [Azorhizobium doebereinerae]|uniref:PD-(D/E)XK nuclease-like domain-containing protein n=1 Tax=Azorhizobium doebereinerae TaxID=281091 RepID=UPI000404CFD4|nr:PD-(D/E)XK nuclease-like domain-containing protein [Azorhizobium doebereinerae]